MTNQRPPVKLWHQIRRAYDEWIVTQQDELLPPRAIDSFLAGWEAAQKKLTADREARGAS
jgi:hypothetical protein